MHKALFQVFYSLDKNIIIIMITKFIGQRQPLYLSGKQDLLNVHLYTSNKTCSMYTCTH